MTTRANSRSGSELRPVLVDGLLGIQNEGNDEAVYWQNIPLSGCFALCGCSVLNWISTPKLQPLTIQDVIVYRSLSANAQTHDWGLPIYDASQIGLGLVRPEDANTHPDNLPKMTNYPWQKGTSFSVPCLKLKGGTSNIPGHGAG